MSNAGGLGVIAAHNAGTPANLHAWIGRVRALAPGKPFGVNFTILPAMGAPPPYDAYAAVVIAAKVPVVETAGSSPKKWISLFKAAGLTTIHKCGVCARTHAHTEKGERPHPLKKKIKGETSCSFVNKRAPDQLTRAGDPKKRFAQRECVHVHSKAGL